jgi:hypothetical protein
MLETEEQGEEDWDLIVEPVEGGFVVLIFAVQGPDIGCDEVEVILCMIVLDWGCGKGGTDKHNRRSNPHGW